MNLQPTTVARASNSANPKSGRSTRYCQGGGASVRRWQRRLASRTVGNLQSKNETTSVLVFG